MQASGLHAVRQLKTSHFKRICPTFACTTPAARCLRTAAGEGGGGGVLFSKLALVDLAGSERAADTQHADAQARSEGAGIN